MTDPTAIHLDASRSPDPFVRRMYGRTAHGGLEIDVPFISPVMTGLYQGGCENGLVLPDEIDRVFSLYPWEKYTIPEARKSQVWRSEVRMYDAEGPIDREVVEEIVDEVVLGVRDGYTVLVHCQAGLNRSGLIAARAVMELLGVTGQEAIDLLRSKRSPAVLCNRDFEQYVRTYGGPMED